MSSHVKDLDFGLLCCTLRVLTAFKPDSAKVLFLHRLCSTCAIASSGLDLAPALTLHRFIKPLSVSFPSCPGGLIQGQKFCVTYSTDFKQESESESKKDICMYSFSNNNYEQEPGIRNQVGL
jgi:hypothetical protein